MVLTLSTILRVTKHKDTCTLHAHFMHTSCALRVHFMYFITFLHKPSILKK